MYRGQHYFHNLCEQQIRVGPLVLKRSRFEPFHHGSCSSLCLKAENEKEKCIHKTIFPRCVYSSFFFKSVYQQTRYGGDLMVTKLIFVISP